MLTGAMARGGDEARRAFEAMFEMGKIDVARIEAAVQQTSPFKQPSTNRKEFALGLSANEFAAGGRSAETCPEGARPAPTRYCVHEGEHSAAGSSAANLFAGSRDDAESPARHHPNPSEVVRWFKGRVTFESNKIATAIPFGWQTRFYDRVIRTTGTPTKKIALIDAT